MTAMAAVAAVTAVAVVPGNKRGFLMFQNIGKHQTIMAGIVNGRRGFPQGRGLRLLFSQSQACGQKTRKQKNTIDNLSHTSPRIGCIWWTGTRMDVAKKPAHCCLTAHSQH